MSKNNAAETAVLNAMAGVADFVKTTHARLQLAHAAGNFETDTETFVSQTGYPLAIPLSELDVTSGQLAIDTEHILDPLASDEPIGSRCVLELSNDGGSTYPYKLYADNTNVAMAAGVQPRLAANTGFVVTED